jgi:hypothetical protein
MMISSPSEIAMVEGKGAVGVAPAPPELPLHDEKQSAAMIANNVDACRCMLPLKL